MSYALDFKSQSERQHNPVSLEPMSIKIHHPHDSLFRAGMSNLSVAKDVMKTHLPKNIVEKTDWNSVQLTNKSYVDKYLRHLQTDMVYSCRINGTESYIYVLIEHQSKPDPLLSFRMLQYNVIMMREHLDQGNKKLPLIANLVLYSGEQSPYPHSTDIYDCFEEPQEARDILFKPLQLIDLGQAKEEELMSHGKARLLELLLKQSRERTFYKWLQGHRQEVVALFETDYWEGALLYILSEEEEYDDDTLLAEIISAKPSKKKDIMNAAQRLIDKGEAIGIQLGMKNRDVQIAERMLKAGEPQEKVTQFTGLSAKEVAAISDRLNPSKN